MRANINEKNELGVELILRISSWFSQSVAVEITPISKTH